MSVELPLACIMRFSDELTTLVVALRTVISIILYLKDTPFKFNIGVSLNVECVVVVLEHKLAESMVVDIARALYELRILILKH